MPGALLGLLVTIAPARDRDQFNVAVIPQKPAYYAGRDNEGRAALLVRSGGGDRPAPLALSGIDARFATPCSIVTEGSERIDTFSTIVCLSKDRGVEEYFCSIGESLVAVLGASPSTADVCRAVLQLVDIFQKLKAPPRRSIVGLLGELCLIAAARDPGAAVRAWRIEGEERFDFVADELRLDVKATTLRGRSHSISFEQANPPPDTTSIIASIWIETVGGGSTVADLVNAIELRLGPDGDAVLRLRQTIADSLGDTLPLAMATRFDMALARSSLRFYDGSDIPALRPPLPLDVSGVQFTSELGDRPRELPAVCAGLSAGACSILPPA